MPKQSWEKPLDHYISSNAAEAVKHMQERYRRADETITPAVDPFSYKWGQAPSEQPDYVLGDWREPKAPAPVPLTTIVLAPLPKGVTRQQEMESRERIYLDREERKRRRGNGRKKNGKQAEIKA